MPLLEKFCDDPLAFGRKMSIEIRGQGLDWSPEDDEQLRKVDKAMYEVLPDSRLQWFTIEPDETYPGTGRVRFGAPRTEGYLPTYYLPWFPNHVYSIKLEPGREEESDPDYFFTAPVDGCSVYVEGDPRSPTVYHANAVDFPQSIYNAKTLSEFMEFYSKRVKHMDKKVGKLSEKVSEPSRHSLPNRSVTIEHYQGPAERSDLFPKVAQVERAEIIKMLGKRGKVLISSDTVTVTKRLGTIFGKRIRGEWEFYVQSRVYVDRIVSDYKHNVSQQGYLRYALSWLNPVDYYSWWTQSTRKESYSFPMRCEPFWPDGAGKLTYK